MAMTLVPRPIRVRSLRITFAASVAFPAALFIFIRLWTMAMASLMLHWLPVQVGKVRLYYGMPPLDGSAGGWLWAPWQRWDTIWYTAIAARGYSPDDLSTAFFPLYPLLIRIITSVLPTNGVAAGLLLSSLAALSAFALFYEYVRAEFGQDSARRALLYLATFPTAFFLFGAYTESLFVLLALAAWWCGKKRRWEVAGLLGGLAALTRPQGMLLALPLAVEFILQYRRGEVLRWRVLNLLMVIAGGFTFLAYVARVDGSLAAWFQIEGYWRQSVLPWEPLLSSARVIFTSGNFALVFLNALDLGLTLLFLALLVWSVRRARWAEAIYMAIIIVPALFAIARFDPNLPLASMSRFLLAAFPGFALLGTIRLREPLPQILAAASLLFQTCLLLIFTQWIFAG